MSRPLPPIVAAALKAAGASALPPAARAELDRRVRRHGYDVSRRNIGGIRSGAHGSKGTLATFPTIAAAAQRIVALSRIAAGETPADAAQGYDPDAGALLTMGDFVTLAPEVSASPLHVVHWSRLMPGDRSGDQGAPGYEVGTTGDVGASPRGGGAALRGGGGFRGSFPRSPRPAAHHVLAVRDRRARAYAPPIDDLAPVEIIEEIDPDETEIDDLGAVKKKKKKKKKPIPPRRPALPSSSSSYPNEETIETIDETIDEETEEDDAAGLAADLAAVEGFWSDLWGSTLGTSPADQAAQDLAASWSALRKVPGVERVPGYAANLAAYTEFARARAAGDDKSAQCHGSCDAGIGPQILTLHTMRDELTKLDPNWIKTIPAQLGGDKRNPIASAIDSVAQRAEERIPGASGWIAFWGGKAPRWQYGIAIAGGVTAAAAVVRAAFGGLGAARAKG